MRAAVGAPRHNASGRLVPDPSGAVQVLPPLVAALGLAGFAAAALAFLLGRQRFFQPAAGWEARYGSFLRDVRLRGRNMGEFLVLLCGAMAWLYPVVALNRFLWERPDCAAPAAAAVHIGVLQIAFDAAVWLAALIKAHDLIVDSVALDDAEADAAAGMLAGPAFGVHSRPMQRAVLACVVAVLALAAFSTESSRYVALCGIVAPIALFLDAALRRLPLQTRSMHAAQALLAAVGAGSLLGALLGPAFVGAWGHGGALLVMLASHTCLVGALYALFLGCTHCTARALAQAVPSPGAGTTSLLVGDAADS